MIPFFADDRKQRIELLADFFHVSKYEEPLVHQFRSLALNDILPRACNSLIQRCPFAGREIESLDANSRALNEITFSSEIRDSCAIWVFRYKFLEVVS